MACKGAMAKLTAFQRYHRYLELIDREAPEPTDMEEYFELLTTGEAVDLLCVRDVLAESDFSPADQKDLARLDDLLVKHYQLIEGNVVTPPGITRSRW